MKRLIAAVALLSLSTGCYKVAVRSQASYSGQRGEAHGVGFLYGAAAAKVDASECPDGIARVETSMPWWGLLVTGLTAGLVTPARAEYLCAVPPSEAAQPVEVTQ